MPTGRPTMNIAFGAQGVSLDAWSKVLRKLGKHCDTSGIADLTGYTLTNTGRTINLLDPQQALVWSITV